MNKLPSALWPTRIAFFITFVLIVAGRMELIPVLVMLCILLIILEAIE